jgi:hypothetical protein
MPYPNTNFPTNVQSQGTLSIGSNTLLTAPAGYRCTISLRFNNPSAYDIELVMNRANPVSSLTVYSLTLSAGDTLEDDGYVLEPGDSLDIVTTTGGTNYFINVRYSLNLQQA